VETRVPDHQISGDGPITVFLLNGVYGSKEMWRSLSERIVRRGYRAVAWDAPGYGTSPLPVPFNFDVVAEAGAALVRSTGSEVNVVFGQSMGGQIAPRILSKVPSLVHGIVITATMGFFGNRSQREQEEFVQRRTGEALARDSMAANRAVVDSMRARNSVGPDVEYVKEVASRTPPETVKAAVEAIRSYPAQEAIAAYRAIDVPALLVAGEDDDAASPETMRRVADLIPDCEFCVVPRSGHYPWAENVEDFDRSFFGFLERRFAAAPAQP
jgi:3-oxoadipate enol-lactonase